MKEKNDTLDIVGYKKFERIWGVDICDSGFSRIEDAKFLSEVSASHGKSKLGMYNFAGEYLQVMGRASCGCTISMRSILTLSKMWNADAKFAKEVSSSPRKGKM